MKLARLEQRWLALWEAAAKASPLDMVPTLQKLAAGFAGIGATTDAERLYKQGTAIREQALGPDHLAVAISLYWLATHYQNEQCFQEAESLYRRALTILDRVLETDQVIDATQVGELSGRNLPSIIRSVLICLADIYQYWNDTARESAIRQRILEQFAQ
jgi:hypothetical protein